MGSYRPARLVLAAFLFPALLQASAPGAKSTLRIGPKEVTVADGLRVTVEAGELQVPESRRRPTARRVTLPFYRLRSESSRPASPIFLLAGGPGSSWIDQFEGDENFREVAFYRTIADVVLYDQRGGGHSRPAMSCPQTIRLRDDGPLDLEAVRNALRSALTSCRDKWLGEGVDLAAYNTVENAADLNALRLALGYGRVTLVGGSYGSHLALQFMRKFPQAVDRVVLFGVEGPDQTWDDPAAMKATLARIAEATERSPAFAGRIPEGGLLRALERVEARLEAAPQTVTVATEAGPRSVVVDATLIRKMARRKAGTRSAANVWPEMILALDRGDYSLVARTAAEMRTIHLADPVHYSMDCASGISPERRKRFRDDPARLLLGDINFEYEALCDLWPSEDLGASFHQNVVSKIPTVIFQGTWDMSTPVENAREVAATLRNGHLVEVIGGGHGALYNLYERWAPMRPALRAFLAGGAADFPASVDDSAAIRFQAPAER